jgi:hypothetical protein
VGAKPLLSQQRLFFEVEAGLFFEVEANQLQKRVVVVAVAVGPVRH